MVYSEREKRTVQSTTCRSKIYRNNMNLSIWLHTAQHVYKWVPVFSYITHKSGCLLRIISPIVCVSVICVVNLTWNCEYICVGHTPPSAHNKCKCGVFWFEHQKSNQLTTADNENKINSRTRRVFLLLLFRLACTRVNLHCACTYRIKCMTHLNPWENILFLCHMYRICTVQ